MPILKKYAPGILPGCDIPGHKELRKHGMKPYVAFKIIHIILGSGGGIKNIRDFPLFVTFTYGLP